LRDSVVRLVEGGRSATVSAVSPSLSAAIVSDRSESVELKTVGVTTWAVGVASNGFSASETFRVSFGTEATGLFWGYSGDSLPIYAIDDAL
jgi:hypothetical protein